MLHTLLKGKERLVCSWTVYGCDPASSALLVLFYQLLKKIFSHFLSHQPVFIYLTRTSKTEWNCIFNWKLNIWQRQHWCNNHQMAALHHSKFGYHNTKFCIYSIQLPYLKTNTCTLYAFIQNAFLPVMVASKHQEHCSTCSWDSRLCC